MEGDCPSDYDPRGNTAVTSVRAMQALLAATFLTLCPPVQAQLVSREPAYGLSGSIGVGVSTVPAYEGIPNRRTLARAELTLSYRRCD